MASTVPDPAALRRFYETDYPRRFPPEASDTERHALFENVLGRAPRLAPGARLLDVGCGGGRLLSAAAARGWRSTGVEVSRRVAVVARAGTAAPVVQADGGALPFRSGALDAVTLVNVVDHLDAPAAALAEARRVLRPGGFVVLRIPNGPIHAACARLLARLGPSARWRGWDGYPILHLFAFGAPALARLVERAGFARVETLNSPRTGGGGVAWRLAGRAIGGLAALAAAVSRGRWLLAPSVEVWAEKPGDDAV